MSSHTLTCASCLAGNLTIDLDSQVATDLLFGKVAKASIPEHSKRLTTTSVKALTATIKYQHSPTDAA